jgi:GH24 family phage-related lysozyme (muramidase)
MNVILKKMFIKHEGLRLKPYRDTVGKLTVGVGGNLMWVFRKLKLFIYSTTI